MPSFYQTDLFNDLVSTGRIDLRVIYARELDPERVKLGWQPLAARCSCESLPPRRRVFSAIARAWREKNRFHIVNGMWAEASFAAALLTFILVGRKFAIYSEAPDPYQARPAWKRLIHTFLGRFIARRATAIFAVSHFAEEFFTRLGVPNALIYAFGYFRSAKPVSQVPHSNKEVIFVGQFVERKGIALLIDAAFPLLRDNPALRLSLLGAGSQRLWLDNRVRELGLEKQVIFESPLPSAEIPKRLAVADVLVLPSSWDGWGLVVNEALAAGIPALVSDRCGAADLIQNGGNGYVCRSGDVHELREALRATLTAPGLLERLKANATITGSNVSSERAANYLIDCLVHLSCLGGPRPTPPWLAVEVLRPQKL